MTREKYKFYILNYIIYNLYNLEFFEETILQMLEDLQLVVPNYCASLFLTDAENDNLLCSPICHPPEFTAIEEHNLKHDEKDFYGWIAHKKTSTVMKLSDLLEEDEEMEPETHHLIYTVIASRNRTLGILLLYRKKEDGDFDDNDIFWLEVLCEHLNQRFYREYMKMKKSDDEAPDDFQWIRLYQLTLREAEITSKILCMKSNVIICDELNISKHTLKKHLQNIYRKTGVRSRKELLLLLRSYK